MYPTCSQGSQGTRTPCADACAPLLTAKPPSEPGFPPPLLHPHTASPSFPPPARPQPRPPPVGVFKSRLSKADLPKQIDWRGTSADFAVKDQVHVFGGWAWLTFVG